MIPAPDWFALAADIVHDLEPYEEAEFTPSNETFAVLDPEFDQ